MFHAENLPKISNLEQLHYRLYSTLKRVCSINFVSKGFDAEFMTRFYSYENIPSDILNRELTKVKMMITKLMN